MIRGSYLGGHTVVTQRRRDFESKLARAVQRHQRRARRAQAGLAGARSAAPVSRDSRPISTHGRPALQAGRIKIVGSSPAY